VAAKSWKLSPSDFAFLWEECRRCFYLKAVRDFYRPRPIMPKIFTLIDSHMKNFYSGKRIHEIAERIPPGVVKLSENWVTSQPIVVSGRLSTCFVKGKFDTVVRFDDGTYGVIDFKTSQRKSDHVPLYSRQLHAYATALENPAPGALRLAPVTRLGLLIFEPSTYAQGKTGRVGFAGDITWLEVHCDDGAFLALLGDVLDVLDSPAPPSAGPSCQWCQYRNSSRRTGF
jgi:hypothetical protein